MKFELHKVFDNKKLVNVKYHDFYYSFEPKTELGISKFFDDIVDNISRGMCVLDN